MNLNCNMIPQITTTVDQTTKTAGSRLFTDLYNYFRQYTNPTDARTFTVHMYETYKNYDTNARYPDTNEPLAKVIIEQNLKDILSYFSVTDEIQRGSDISEFTAKHYDYFNAVLGNLFMSNIGSLEKLTMADIRHSGKSIKTVLFNLLQDAIEQDIAVNPVHASDMFNLNTVLKGDVSKLAPGTRLYNWEKFKKEYLAYDSYLWENFKLYMKNVHHININSVDDVNDMRMNGLSNPDTTNTTEAMDNEGFNSEQWYDENQMKIDRATTIPGKIRMKLASIIKDRTNSRGDDYLWIKQPYTLNELFTSLSQLHNNNRTIKEVRHKLQIMATTTNRPLYIDLLAKFDEDPEFAVQYTNTFSGISSIRAVALTVNKSKGNQNLSYNYKNSTSFGSDAMFNDLLDVIKDNIIKKKYTNEHKQLFKPTWTLGATNVVEQLHYYLNNNLMIPVSRDSIFVYLMDRMQAMDSTMTANAIWELPKGVIDDILYEIIDNVNALADLVYTTKKVKNIAGDTSGIDFKGYLSYVSNMAASDGRANVKLSYLNTDGEMQYTSQYASYLSKIFDGLTLSDGTINRSHVLETFGNLRNVNYLNKYDNMLMDHSNSKYGIFAKVGDKVVFNSKFINALKFEQFLGSETYFRSGNVNVKNALSDRYKFMQTVMALSGKYMILTGDAGRSYFISAPAFQPDAHNLDDFMNNTTLRNSQALIQQLCNIVKADIQEYLDAENWLYTDETRTVLKPREELLKLHNVKHISTKVDDLVHDNDGKYVGKSFKFLNLKYIKNGKDYTFADYMADNNIDIQTYRTMDSSTAVLDFVRGFITSTYNHDILGKLAKYKPLINNLKHKSNYTIIDKGEIRLRTDNDYLGVFREILYTKKNINTEGAEYVSWATERNLKPELKKTKNQYISYVLESKNKIVDESQNIDLLTAFLNNLVFKTSFNNLLGTSVTESVNQIKWNKYNTGLIKIGWNLSDTSVKDNQIKDATDVNVFVAKDLKMKNLVVGGMEQIFKKYGAQDLFNQIMSESITTTDGISIITDVHLERYLRASRGLSPAQEQMIKNLREQKNLDPREVHTVFEQIKTYAYHKSVVNDGTVAYPKTQVFKDSTIILFPQYVKGTDMERIYNWMNSNKIDQLSFDSTHKIGGTYPGSIYDSEGNFIGDKMSKQDRELSTTRIPITSYVIQQDIHDHIMNAEDATGSQVGRITLSGLNSEEAIYELNGKKLTGNQIAVEFSNSLHSLVYDGLVRFFNKVGAISNGKINIDNGTVVVDRQKVMRSVKNSLLTNVKSQNDIASISDTVDYVMDELGNVVDTNNEMMFALSNPAIRTKLASYMNSLINKHTIRQEVAGITVPIMPNISWTYNTIENKARLKTMSAEEMKQHYNDGAITYTPAFLERAMNRKEGFNLLNERIDKDGNYYKAEVILNVFDREIYDNLLIEQEDGRFIVDMSKIDPKALEMFGFRIPTEGRQSIVLFEVVGFLNTGTSQAQFPYDLVLQTGWDFDIDKVYAYRKNNFVDKDGIYKPYPYQHLDGNMNRLYVRNFIERYYKDEYYKLNNNLTDESDRRGGNFELFNDGYFTYFAWEATRWINQFNKLVKNTKGEIYPGKKLDVQNLKDKLDRTGIKKLKTIKSMSNTLNEDIMKILDIVNNSSSINLPSTTKTLNTLLNNAIYNKVFSKSNNKVFKGVVKKEITIEEMNFINKLLIKINDTVHNINDAKQEFLKEYVNTENPLTLSDNRKVIYGAGNGAHRIINEAFIKADIKNPFVNIKEVDGKQVFSSTPVMNKINQITLDIANRYKEFINTKEFQENYKSKSENEKLPREALENRMIDILFAIHSNPYHFIERNKPNTYYQSEDVSDDVNKAYNRSIEQLQYNNMSDEGDLRNLNISSTKLKGFSVNNDNVLRLLGSVNAYYAGDNIPFIKLDRNDFPTEWSDKQIESQVKRNYRSDSFHIVKENGKITHVEVQDRTFGNNRTGDNTDISGNRITEQLSQMTAHILDSVAHPMGFNINEKTIDLLIGFTYGATMVYDQERKSWNRYAYGNFLIHNPVIVEAVDNMSYDNITGKRSFESSISHVRQHYYKQLRDAAVAVNSGLESTGKRYSIDDYELILSVMYGNEQGLARAKQLYSAGNLKSMLNKPMDPIDAINIANMALNTLDVVQSIKEVVFATKVEQSLGVDYDSLVQMESKVADLYIKPRTFDSIIRNMMYLTGRVEDHHLIGNSTEENQFKMSVAQAAQFIRNMYKSRTLSERVEIVRTVEDLLDVGIHNSKIKLANGKSFLNAVFPTLMSGENIITDNGINDKYIKTNPVGLIESRFILGTMMAKEFTKKISFVNSDRARRVIDDIIPSSWNNSKAVNTTERSIINMVGFTNSELGKMFLYENRNEYKRLMNIYENGVDNISDNSDIQINDNKFDAETFRSYHALTPSEKLSLLRTNSVYMRYVNQPQFDGKHVINKIKPWLINDNQIGLRLSIDSSNADFYIRSLSDMYYNSDPYLADLGRDLVMYAIYNDGLAFGFNIAKAVDANIIGNPDRQSNLTYLKYLQEAGLDNNLVDPAEFNAAIKLEDIQSVNNNSGTDYSSVYRYVYKQNYNNPNLVPVIPDELMIFNDEFTPTFHRNVNLNIDGIVSNIKVESNLKLANSPTYNYAPYIYDMDNDVLYQAYKYDTFTVYVETNKLMPNEFSDNGNSSALESYNTKRDSWAVHQYIEDNAELQNLFAAIAKQSENLTANALVSSAPIQIGQKTDINHITNIVETNNNLEEAMYSESIMEMDAINEDNQMYNSVQEELNSEEELGNILDNSITSETYKHNDVISAVSYMVQSHQHNLWLGDTNSLAGKYYKSNNAILVNTESNPLEEANRILPLIRNTKQISISGNEVDPTWTMIFFNRLHNSRSAQLSDYSTFGNTQTGQVLSSMGVTSHVTDSFYSMSNVRIDSNSISAKRDVYTRNADVIIKSYATINTINRQAKFIQIPDVRNIARLNKAITESGIAAELTSKNIIDVYDNLLNGLEIQYEIVKASVNILSKLYNNIYFANPLDPTYRAGHQNAVDLNDVFSNETRRTEYQNSLAKALMFIRTVKDVERLKELSYQDVGLDPNNPADVVAFDNSYKAINEQISKIKHLYTNSTKSIESIHYLAKRYAAFSVAYFSRRTDIPTVFREIIKQHNIPSNNTPDIVISEHELAELIDQVFNNNEDLTWAIANLDSAFNTTNTLVDTMLKEYMQYVAKGKEEMNKFQDRLIDIVRAIDPKLVTDNAKAKAWFKKYINQDDHTLISPYKYSEFTRALYDMEYAINKELNELIVIHNLNKHDAAIHRSRIEARRIAEFIKDHTANNNKDIFVRSNEYIVLMDRLNKMTDSQRARWKFVNGYREVRLFKKNVPQGAGFTQGYHSALDKQGNPIQVPDDKVSVMYKFTPADKYKDARWTGLSTEEQTMVNKIRDLIQEVAHNTYPNGAVSKDFFPYLSEQGAWKTIKNKFASVTKDSVKPYNRVDGRIGYHIKPKTMSVPEYYQRIDTNRNDSDAVRIADANLKYAKAKRQAIPNYTFTSLDDITNYNREVNKLNKANAANSHNYNPISALSAFANELTHIKAVEHFVDTFDILVHAIEYESRFTKKTMSKDNVIDRAKSLLTGNRQFVDVAGSETRLKDVLDRVLPLVYNVKKNPDKTTKAFQPIGKFTSMTYMWANYLSGVKNVMTGSYQMITKAAGGDILTKNDLLHGSNAYIKLVPTMMSGLKNGFENMYTDNKDLALIKHFDEIFQDTGESGQYIKGSNALAEGLNSFDRLMYAPNTVGEHYMQYTMLLAMARSHRVVNGVVMSKAQFKTLNLERALMEMLRGFPDIRTKWDKYLKARKNDIKYKYRDINLYSQFLNNIGGQFQQDVINLRKQYDAETATKWESYDTLIDTLNTKNGRLSYDSSKLSLRELTDFGQKVKRVNQSMHGVYNDIDRNAVQDHIIGDLFLQFKKWVRPNMRMMYGARFGRESFSEGLGQYENPVYGALFNMFRTANEWSRYNTEEGMYRTAIVHYLRGLGHIISNFRIYKNSLDDVQRASLKQFGSHISFVIGSILSLLGLGALLGDDDDDQLFGLTAMYILSSWNQEVIESVPGVGWYGFTTRMLDNPFASQKVFVDTTKLLKAAVLMLDGDPDNDTYKSGLYQGENRLKMLLWKQIPIWRQYQKQIYIPQYTKYYNLINPFI